MSCIQSPAWILLEIKLWSSFVISDLWKRINGILIPASRTDLSSSGSCAITWWWLPQRYTQDTRRTRSWTENILRAIEWGLVPSFHLHVRSDDQQYGQARSHWVWTKGFHSITGGILYTSGSPTCSPPEGQNKLLKQCFALDDAKGAMQFCTKSCHVFGIFEELTTGIGIIRKTRKILTRQNRKVDAICVQLQNTRQWIHCTSCKPKCTILTFIGPSNHRTSDPSNHWITNPSNSRTNDPWNQRTTEPPIHRTIQPTIHWTTKPLNQRVTSPVI